MSEARLTAIVRGRVQGVGYRAFVVDHAQELGLDGFVRNLPGGRTVEVVAEGPRERLETLMTHLRRGPLAARVDGVDAHWGSTGGTGPGFEARA